LFTFGQPFLIGQLVSYVQSGEGGIGVGIGYALGFAALSLIASTSFSIAFDILRRLGVAVRSCLMLAVYEQSLKLTTSARMQNTIGIPLIIAYPLFSVYLSVVCRCAGQTTNLMAIDCEKLNLAAPYVHFLWYETPHKYFVPCLF